MENLQKKKILGVGVTNATIQQVLEFVVSSFEKPGKKYYIVTPNPEIVVYASKHNEFKAFLNQAQISLCDGIGLQLASILLGKPIKERITGTDFVKIFCENVSEKNISIGFLGAKEGVAELAAERLLKMYPELQIIFVAPEWEEQGFINARKIHDARVTIQEKKNMRSINHKSSIMNRHIDMLFVGYGFPKQEEWMAEHIDKLPVTVMMGVGGAFDYLSGKVSRAPLLIRFIGFEWLYRLFRQPWRIRRQLALLEFVWLVIKGRSNAD